MARSFLFAAASAARRRIFGSVPRGNLTAQTIPDVLAATDEGTTTQVDLRTLYNGVSDDTTFTADSGTIEADGYTLTLSTDIVRSVTVDVTATKPGRDPVAASFNLHVFDPLVFVGLANVSETRQDAGTVSVALSGGWQNGYGSRVYSHPNIGYISGSNLILPLDNVFDPAVTVTVNATDQSGRTVSGSLEFLVETDTPLVAVTLPAFESEAVSGQTLTIPLAGSATGGTPPYTYSAPSRGTIEGENLVLIYDGTPITETITFTVTDSKSPTAASVQSGITVDITTAVFADEAGIVDTNSARLILTPTEGDRASGIAHVAYITVPEGGFPAETRIWSAYPDGPSGQPYSMIAGFQTGSIWHALHYFDSAGDPQPHMTYLDDVNIATPGATMVLITIAVAGGRWRTFTSIDGSDFALGADLEVPAGVTFPTTGVPIRLGSTSQSFITEGQFTFALDDLPAEFADLASLNAVKDSIVNADGSRPALSGVYDILGVATAAMYGTAADYNLGENRGLAGGTFERTGTFIDYVPPADTVEAQMAPPGEPDVLRFDQAAVSGASGGGAAPTAAAIFVVFASIPAAPSGNVHTIRGTGAANPLFIRFNDTGGADFQFPYTDGSGAPRTASGSFADWSFSPGDNVAFLIRMQAGSVEGMLVAASVNRGTPLHAQTKTSSITSGSTFDVGSLSYTIGEETSALDLSGVFAFPRTAMTVGKSEDLIFDQILSPAGRLGDPAQVRSLFGTPALEWHGLDAMVNHGAGSDFTTATGTVQTLLFKPEPMAAPTLTVTGPNSIRVARGTTPEVDSYDLRYARDGSGWATILSAFNASTLEYNLSGLQASSLYAVETRPSGYSEWGAPATATTEAVVEPTSAVRITAGELERTATAGTTEAGMVIAFSTTVTDGTLGSNSFPWKWSKDGASSSIRLSADQIIARPSYTKSDLTTTTLNMWGNTGLADNLGHKFSGVLIGNVGGSCEFWVSIDGGEPFQINNTTSIPAGAQWHIHEALHTLFSRRDGLVWETSGAALYNPASAPMDVVANWAKFFDASGDMADPAITDAHIGVAPLISTVRLKAADYEIGANAGTDGPLTVYPGSTFEDVGSSGSADALVATSDSYATLLSGSAVDYSLPDDSPILAKNMALKDRLTLTADRSSVILGETVYLRINGLTEEEQALWGFRWNLDTAGEFRHIPDVPWHIRQKNRGIGHHQTVAYETLGDKSPTVQVFPPAWSGIDPVVLSLAAPIEQRDPDVEFAGKTWAIDPSGVGDIPAGATRVADYPAARAALAAANGGRVLFPRGETLTHGGQGTEPSSYLTAVMFDVWGPESEPLPVIDLNGVGGFNWTNASANWDAIIIKNLRHVGGYDVVTGDKAGSPSGWRITATAKWSFIGCEFSNLNTGIAQVERAVYNADSMVGVYDCHFTAWENFAIYSEAVQKWLIRGNNISQDPKTTAHADGKKNSGTQNYADHGPIRIQDSNNTEAVIVQNKMFSNNGWSIGSYATDDNGDVKPSSHQQCLRLFVRQIIGTTDALVAENWFEAGGMTVGGGTEDEIKGAGFIVIQGNYHLCHANWNGWNINLGGCWVHNNIRVVSDTKREDTNPGTWGGFSYPGPNETSPDPDWHTKPIRIFCNTLAWFLSPVNTYNMSGNGPYAPVDHYRLMGRGEHTSDTAPDIILGDNLLWAPNTTLKNETEPRVPDGIHSAGTFSDYTPMYEGKRSVTGAGVVYHDPQYATPADAAILPMLSEDSSLRNAATGLVGAFDALGRIRAEKDQGAVAYLVLKPGSGDGGGGGGGGGELMAMSTTDTMLTSGQDAITVSDLDGQPIDETLAARLTLTADRTTVVMGEAVYMRIDGLTEEEQALWGLLWDMDTTGEFQFLADLPWHMKQKNRALGHQQAAAWDTPGEKTVRVRVVPPKWSGLDGYVLSVKITNLDPDVVFAGRTWIVDPDGVSTDEGIKVLTVLEAHQAIVGSSSGGRVRLPAGRTMPFDMTSDADKNGRWWYHDTTADGVYIDTWGGTEKAGLKPNSTMRLENRVASPDTFFVMRNLDIHQDYDPTTGNGFCTTIFSTHTQCHITLNGCRIRKMYQGIGGKDGSGGYAPVGMFAMYDCDMTDWCRYGVFYEKADRAIIRGTSICQNPNAVVGVDGAKGHDANFTDPDNSDHPDSGPIRFSKSAGDRIIVSQGRLFINHGGSNATGRIDVSVPIKAHQPVLRIGTTFSEGMDALINELWSEGAGYTLGGGSDEDTPGSGFLVMHGCYHVQGPNFGGIGGGHTGTWIRDNILVIPNSEKEVVHAYDALNPIKRGTGITDTWATKDVRHLNNTVLFLATAAQLGTTPSFSDILAQSESPAGGPNLIVSDEVLWAPNITLSGESSPRVPDGIRSAGQFGPTPQYIGLHIETVDGDLSSIELHTQSATPADSNRLPVLSEASDLRNAATGSVAAFDALGRMRAERDEGAVAYLVMKRAA